MNAKQNGQGNAAPGSSRCEGLPNKAQGSNRYEALPAPGPTFLGVSIPAFTVSDQIKLNDHSEDRTRTPAPPSPRASQPFEECRSAEPKSPTILELD